MTKERNLYLVLRAVLQCLPCLIDPSYTDRLQSLSDRVVYTAPEARSPLWQLGQAIIDDLHSAFPKAEWMRQVLSCWKGEAI